MFSKNHVTGTADVFTSGAPGCGAGCGKSLPPNSQRGYNQVMAASDDKAYVIPGERGALLVGSAGVALDGVLAGWRLGHSPETLRAQYPALTLEEVYGAITWCLAHPEQADAYEGRQASLWQQEREHAERQLPAVVVRLRALDRSVHAT